MEINITIFIQALIFLMLFIFSSRFLFYPLKKLFNQRHVLVAKEKNRIYQKQFRVTQQNYYLSKLSFLIDNKIRRKKDYIERNIHFIVRRRSKDKKFRINEKYRDIKLKLFNEFTIAKKKIIKDKDNAVEVMAMHLGINR